MHEPEFTYVPAEHVGAAHASELVLDAGDVWPDGHAVGAVAVPPAQKEFAGHAVHAPEFTYDPAEHVVGAEVHAAELVEPAGDDLPDGHAVHAYCSAAVPM